MTHTAYGMHINPIKSQRGGGQKQSSAAVLIYGMNSEKGALKKAPCKSQRANLFPLSN